MAAPVQPDWEAMYAALVAQIGSPVRVSTPALGETEFPRPNELIASINTLKLLAAESAGISTAGVFVVGYDRGLGPTKGSV